MTITELTAILVAGTGLIAAITALVMQLRELTQHLNSRLDELVEVTRDKAFAEGQKAEHALTHGPVTEETIQAQ